MSVWHSQPDHALSCAGDGHVYIASPRHWIAFRTVRLVVQETRQFENQLQSSSAFCVQCARIFTFFHWPLQLPACVLLNREKTWNNSNWTGGPSLVVGRYTMLVIFGWDSKAFFVARCTATSTMRFSAVLAILFWHSAKLISVAQWTLYDNQQQGGQTYTQTLSDQLLGNAAWCFISLELLTICAWEQFRQDESVLGTFCWKKKWQRLRVGRLFCCFTF